MKDRVPIYPGRVTLTPVSGQANTFDLVRADQPTQEGTPLNKASLLKDATAALFGKTNAAVPDDILSLLSKSMMAHIEGEYTKITDVLGNLIAIPAGQIKDGVKIAVGSYTGTGTYDSSNPNSLTFSFEPKILMISDNPTSYPLGMDHFGMWFSGIDLFISSGTGSQGYQPIVNILGNIISWYASSDVYQLNVSGREYHYIAIG